MTAPAVEICAACNGNGEIATKVNGRHEPEPYTYRTCARCRGEGSLGLEAS